MKRFVADTNIFLRFLLNDIPSQADEIEKYFKQAREGEKGFGKLRRRLVSEK